MLIIGIAGGSGSGKTTVVNKIIKGLPKDSVSLITQDSYYKDLAHLPREERAKVNFDHPNSLDFVMLQQHLRDLKKGICSVWQRWR